MYVAKFSFAVAVDLERPMNVLLTKNSLTRLICFGQILLTPPDEGPRVKGQRIKLQDIVDGQYAPQKINGTWINGEFDFQF